MRSIETFEELLTATDLQTVVDVAAMNALNSSIRPSVREIRGEASFQNRVEDAFSSTTDGNRVRAKRAMAILLACVDFETGRALQGIGGCTGRPLRDILRDARLLTDEQPSAAPRGF